MRGDSSCRWPVTEAWEGRTTGVHPAEMRLRRRGQGWLHDFRDRLPVHVVLASLTSYPPPRKTETAKFPSSSLPPAMRPAVDESFPHRRVRKRK